MSISHRGLATILLCVFTTWAGAWPLNAATLIRTQPPCKTVPCVSFGPSDTVVTVRSFLFKAPGKGRAIVSFHGSLYCLSNSPNLAYFILETQIVEGNAEPNGRGPSGLEITQSTEPYDTGSLTFSYNLASTRVVPVSGPGNKVFRFRVKKVAMAASSGCSVFNGTFTVQFVQ